MHMFVLFAWVCAHVAGVNSSGTRMVVNRLCEGVPRPLSRTPRADMLQVQHGEGLGMQGGKPLRLMVASGPFCCTNNLEYEPLKDVFHKAATGEDPADVLVLCGPFIDAAHPRVAKGEVEMEAEDGSMETIDFFTLFSFKISGLIEGLFEQYPESKLQIVMVPSLADAHHDYVYPQPPLRDQVPNGVASPFFPDEKLFSLDIPFTKGGVAEKRVHLVSNPCMLRINEVVLGVTSVDALLHLGREEIANRPVSNNRITRLAEHLLMQQSFYPIFPSSAADAAPLDMKFYDKVMMPVSPDILITPSKLTTFSRVLSNGTLAINPGQTAKGTTGGTYADLTVYPMAKEGTGADTPEREAVPHQVAERSIVDILRI